MQTAQVKRSVTSSGTALAIVTLKLVKELVNDKKAYINLNLQKIHVKTL